MPPASAQAVGPHKAQYPPTSSARLPRRLSEIRERAVHAHKAVKINEAEKKYSVWSAGPRGSTSRTRKQSNGRKYTAEVWRPPPPPHTHYDIIETINLWRKSPWATGQTNSGLIIYYVFAWVHVHLVARPGDWQGRAQNTVMTQLWKVLASDRMMVV